MSTEVVRKICCVFKELFTSLEKETEALRNRVKHLESELKSERNSAAKKIRTQAVQKTKPAGQWFKHRREPPQPDLWWYWAAPQQLELRHHDAIS